jgi:hypothetical protein
MAVEVPLVLLVASQMVWRIRSTTDLADNPLDAAGVLRTSLVLLAGLLGLAALVQARLHEGPTRQPLPAAWRLYGAYVAVVFLGAPLSASPLLTAYRGLELAAGLVVLLGARRTGPDGLDRVESTLYAATVVSLLVIWAEVALLPHLAVLHLTNPLVPIPLEIQGVFPAVTPNTIGTSGVLVVFWTIGRAPHHWPGKRLLPGGLVLLGFVSLLAAQYRTGYAMLGAGLVVLLLMRRRWEILLVLVFLGLFLNVYHPQLAGSVAPYALRGDSLEQAKGLDSRVDWWSAALPAWREAPWIGKGLLTGTRIEVLSRLGLNETSSIHGAWVEALVGTGVVGCGLLALAYLTALGHSRGWMRVLLLLLGLRSVTGQTFESFGALCLLFLWAAAAKPSSEFVGDSDAPWDPHSSTMSWSPLTPPTRGWVQRSSWRLESESAAITAQNGSLTPGSQHSGSTWSGGNAKA